MFTFRTLCQHSTVKAYNSQKSRSSQILHATNPMAVSTSFHSFYLCGLNVSVKKLIKPVGAPGSAVKAHFPHSLYYLNVTTLVAS